MKYSEVILMIALLTLTIIAAICLLTLTPRSVQARSRLPPQPQRYIAPEVHYQEHKRQWDASSEVPDDYANHFHPPHNDKHEGHEESEDEHHHVHWCYDHNECNANSKIWVGDCHKGAHQSPIQLPEVPQDDVKEARLHFSEEYFIKYPKWTILNNGHTIQIQLPSDVTSLPRLSGYEMDNDYIFAQMHFHWGEDILSGSEHNIGQYPYPLEAHFVHYSSRYDSLSSAASATDDPKALAVVGVFFAVEYNWDRPEYGIRNKPIDAIINSMPQNPAKLDGVDLDISLSDFLPISGSGEPFYRYMGSLTTPPCSEIVLWTVFKRPLLITADQLESFRWVKDDAGELMNFNFRPTQSLNERKVQTLIQDPGYYWKK